MKEILNSLRKDTKGQAVIMFAGILAIVLAIGAVTVDFGFLSWQKRELQNIADTAALAGAWELPDGEYEVMANEYVREYIDAEGVASTPITDPDGSIVRKYTDNDGIPTIVRTKRIDNKRIRVEINREYNSFFAKVFSIDTNFVYAMAEAEKNSWYTGLLPFALRDNYIGEDDPIDKTDPDYPINDPDYPLNFDLEKYVSFMEDKIPSDGDDDEDFRINLWGKDDNENLKFGLVKLGEYSYPYKVNTSPKDVIEAGLDKSIYEEDLYIGSGLDSSIADALEGKNNPKPDDYPGFLNLSNGEGYIIGVLPSRAALLENSTGNNIIYWEEYVILHFTDLIYSKNGNVHLSGVLRNVYNISDPDFSEDDFKEDFFIGKSSKLIK